jgi:hypothetical protein
MAGDCEACGEHNCVPFANLPTFMMLASPQGGICTFCGHSIRGEENE